MSGGNRNKKGGRRSDRSVGDVTLNDFANAPVCKSRPKKSFTSVSLVVKQEMVEIDNRSWDEKLDDFEGDFDFVKEENEDGTTSVVIKRPEVQSRRKKRTINSQDESFCVGNEYPLDIWFLISEYIKPEDIGRFAAICRSTFAVVNSAKFWFGVYRRYYRSVPNLPERLQPECMVRLYGLRPCVIRALHYMYPPFVSKLKSVTTFEGDPHALARRQCVLMWHTKMKGHWLFYFKLKQNNSFQHCRGYRPRYQPDLIEMLEDVTANQDEDCRVLQVTCLNYIPTPLVLGLTLTSVSLTLSQGMRYHRLQLTFGSNVVCSSSHKILDASSSTAIVLDPVINVRVLDWWHPMYPHSGSVALLVNDE